MLLRAVTAAGGALHRARKDACTSYRLNSLSMQGSRVQRCYSSINGASSGGPLRSSFFATQANNFSSLYDQRFSPCAPKKNFFLHIHGGDRHASCGKVRLFSNVKYAPPDNSDKKDDENNETGDKKPGKWQQLKTAFKEYRYVFLAYYGTTFLLPIPFLWVTLEGVGLDGVALLQLLGADKIYEGVNNWSSSFINFLVAVEMNELLEFVRIPVVISTTPKVAKWWRARKENNHGGREE